MLFFFNAIDATSLHLQTQLQKLQLPLKKSHNYSHSTYSLNNRSIHNCNTYTLLSSRILVATSISIIGTAATPRATAPIKRTTVLCSYSLARVQPHIHYFNRNLQHTIATIHSFLNHCTRCFAKQSSCCSQLLRLRLLVYNY